MSCKSYPRSATCLLLWMVVLAFTSTASAEWKEKVLHSFQRGNDGATPAGGVVFDSAGNLYGVTTDGGTSCPPPGCGTVFQLAPPAKKGGAWTETVLHVFDGNDGSRPAGSVILDAKGNLYGTTAYGGTGTCILLGGNVGCGLVYELSPPAKKGGEWTYSILYSFLGGKDGQYPSGNLVFDAVGNLYGATIYGGGFQGTCNAPYYLYCGTVFELSPPKTKDGKWKEKVLYSFKGVKSGQDSGDGASPNGGLILDSKGAIYGTTYFGGNNQKGICDGGVGGTGCGIVFKLIPPVNKVGSWTKKTLHQFDAQDGSNSAAGVVFDGTGNLYGTTSGGPPNGFGLVFELKKPSGKAHSWTETILYAFSGRNDGEDPIASVIFDANGNLYGTNYYGGPFSGIVFRLKAPIRQLSGWTFGILYGFTGSPDGAQPAANLIFDKNGSLYSTTQKGGTGACSFYGCGTVFEISP
jgi:hypothetical protein